MIIPKANIDYIGILKYLEENQSIPYSNPEKLFGEDKEKMLTIRKKGQHVIEEMKKIAEQAKNLYGLDKCLPASWLDGSRVKTRNYLWTQMKYQHDNESPISISIFIEKGKQNKAYLRISLEIKNDGTNKAVMKQYHKHFEIPQKAGLVYVSGSNEQGIPEVLNETQNIIISKIENRIYKKVQICKFVKHQEKKSNTDYHQEVMKAISEILPYYNHVLEKNKFVKEKLLTWNSRESEIKIREPILKEGLENLIDKNDDFWPSLDEYNPEITKEEWIKFINEVEKLEHPSTIKMLVAMLELKGQASCKQLSEIYGGTPNAYIGYTASFGRRVKKYFGKSGCMDTDQERVFVLPFQGKYISGKSGKYYTYRIRPELKAALEEIDLSKFSPYYNKNEKESKKMVYYPKNLILYGPPGTGKTYSSVIYAVAICEKLDIDTVKKMDYKEVMNRYKKLKKDGQIVFITFHQSYGYEEFIEGIKPIIDEEKKEIGYKVESGSFKCFCEFASTKEIKTNFFETSSQSTTELAKTKNVDLSNTKIVQNNKNYVFIIDEINRGNISKIFGELITLIEDTKRAGMDEEASAVLPYSGQVFSVPSNVYILGTMNTADRSIALLDTALRRRFEFIEMMPDLDVLRTIGANMVEDLDIAEMLGKINERITILYDREHTIGHAFFTKLAKEPTIDVLKSIFEKSVIPLLQEYFYEDYQKIQLILGDNGKNNDAHKFILDTNIKIKDIFKGNVSDDINLPEKKYIINHKAFSNIDSYKEII